MSVYGKYQSYVGRKVKIKEVPAAYGYENLKEEDEGIVVDSPQNMIRVMFPNQPRYLCFYPRELLIRKR